MMVQESQVEASQLLRFLQAAKSSLFESSLIIKVIKQLVSSETSCFFEMPRWCYL